MSIAQAINETHKSGSADLTSQVLLARKAQSEWIAIPLRERIRRIRKIREYILDNSPQIAETISRENGKVLVDALATELLPAAIAVSYYSKKATCFLKPERIKPATLIQFNKRSVIHRKPFGVVAVVSPWNYPFAIPFSEIIMALLAGNAVILKTASNMPAVSRLLVECICSAELPEGLFQYIDLPGKIAGDALLNSGIDKLFFTGSVTAGKVLMKKASETLTPVVLELGGNDAMIVCEDADLDRAAAGAVWAGFSGAGQSCGGVERLYVAAEIYESFMEILNAKVAAIVAESEDPHAVELGALTTDKQLEHVKKHVNDAVQQGAVIAFQSDRSDESARQYPATVLTRVDHSMDVMKDETFGPVIGVMPFTSIEDAVRLANDSTLGLTASVWSKNRRKAIRIGRQINAGAITVNDHLMSHGLPETPWGGFKQSGIGRTHGKLGFDEMTQPQVVVDDSLSFTKKNLWWPPYNRKLYDGLNGIIQMLYAKGPGKRLIGLSNLLKITDRFF